jgi:nucleotide-binding universal stress UspA family protein
LTIYNKKSVIREANMKIKDILFPTDFSEAAGRALPHVMTMAGKFDSRIRVLHVRVPYADDPNRPQYLFVDEDRYTKYVEDQLQKTLDRLEPDHRVSTAFSRGVSPAVGILRHLERSPVDVVVMGTHGRSALRHFLLGTVAEKVVRHARCPVLTVAYGRKNYRDNPSFQRILVPFDFSEYSIGAVRYARELARSYDADLQVLYVVAREVQPSLGEFSEIPDDVRLAKLADKAGRALGKTLVEQGLDSVTPHVDIEKGAKAASEGIVDFADQNSVDLITMARHGLTGKEHALMGSTTERVVRTAPCPVLTI